MRSAEVRVRLLLLFGFAVAGVASVVAQEPPPTNSGAVIRSESREVALDVIVRDAKGHPVLNLRPDEITVLEDGKPRPVRAFRLVKGEEAHAELDTEPAPAPVSKHTILPGTKLDPLRPVNLVCLLVARLNAETRANAIRYSELFVDRELRPNTFIGVFTLTPGGVRQMLDFSNNRAVLADAIRRTAAGQTTPLSLGANPAIGPLSFAPVPNNASGQATSSPAVGMARAGDMRGATKGILGRGAFTPTEELQYGSNAAMQTVDLLMSLVKGLGALPYQKTVVMLTTGITRPIENMDYWYKLLETANQLGVTFYGVDVYGNEACDPTASLECLQRLPSTSSAMLGQAAQLSRMQTQMNIPLSVDGNNIMKPLSRADQFNAAATLGNIQEGLRELAISTGGFLIANTDNVEPLFKRVMEDVDTRYELAYSPAGEGLDGRHHTIEIKIARKGVVARAREGYFAVPGAAMLSHAEAEALKALTAETKPHEFDFAARAFRFPEKDGATRVSVAFEVPVAALKDTTAGAMHRYHVSLAALVRDDQGNVIERIGRDVPSIVDDEHVAKIRKQHIDWQSSAILAPGHYTVQAAVYDHEAQRASTTSFGFDVEAREGLIASDVSLARLVDPLKRKPNPEDPFESTTARIVPAIGAQRAAPVLPPFYLKIRPRASSEAKPRVRIRISRDGQTVATKNVVVAVDEPVISMLIAAGSKNTAAPGDYKVKLTVEQDREKVERELAFQLVAP